MVNMTNNETSNIQASNRFDTYYKGPADTIMGDHTIFDNLDDEDGLSGLGLSNVYRCSQPSGSDMTNFENLKQFYAKNHPNVDPSKPIQVYDFDLSGGDDSGIDDGANFHFSDLKCGAGAMIPSLVNMVWTYEAHKSDPNAMFLIHCTQGKDRTGVASSLLALLAGAPLSAVEAVQTDMRGSNDIKTLESYWNGGTLNYDGCSIQWSDLAKPGFDPNSKPEGSDKTYAQIFALPSKTSVQ